MAHQKVPGPATEVWLRCHIPQWGSLRDRAVAAGLIEPETPVITESQAKAMASIAEIRSRVTARLHKPANNSIEE